MGAGACHGKRGFLSQHVPVPAAGCPPHSRRLCRAVPLHLSNGVCGIFLLSPLCCRKREVREPQAPAPVLQVTRPSPSPKSPTPGGTGITGTAPCFHLLVGLAARRGETRVWLGRWGRPRRAAAAAQRGQGAPGNSAAGRGAQLGERPAPALHREEPAGCSPGQRREPGQPLAAPAVPRSITKWYRRQHFPPPPAFYHLKVALCPSHCASGRSGAPWARPGAMRRSPCFRPTTALTLPHGDRGRAASAAGTAPVPRLSHRHVRQWRGTCHRRARARAGCGGAVVPGLIEQRYIPGLLAEPP